MDNTTAEVDVQGRRVREIRGGSGRPLLYLHSAMGEAQWVPHLSALAANYELHAPAHPGFLTSEGIEEISHIEDMAAHYLNYLDAMGWDSVDVVGLSLGGWIGAELAARYPDRVGALVLAAAVGIWVPERPIADFFALDPRFPERRRAMLFHDVECPAARMIVAPAGPKGLNLPDEMFIGVLKALAATAKVGWNPLLHNPRLEKMLHRVTARTLCLWGEHDQLVPPVYGEKFARLIPGAKLRIVPECGHMIPFEKAEAFVAAVREFLG